MPVTPTYPGIYIEELPSSARTITAAPTSIAVFVGYTHPFKTKPENFNKAIQIFNFTEYEREFGGFYSSGIFDTNMAYAVNNFFLNGGSVAYIVGLKAENYYRSNNNPPVPITAPTTLIGADPIGIVFTALEPTDDQITMQVSVTPDSTGNTADILITYNSRVENYRGVSLDSSSENYIDKRLGTVSKPISSLVTVAPASGGYGGSFTSATQKLTSSLPSNFETTFSSTDFTKVFSQDSSLDKVSIFNLLIIPGIADTTIWSTALAFCERKQAFLILDPPKQAVPDGTSDPNLLMALLMTKADSPIPKSTNGAIYFPYLRSTNPLTGQPLDLPPSGYVAGIYAKTDLNRGVWKAPAGLETIISNTIGVVEEGRMTDQRQGTLNPIGVNCIRSFPGVGTVVYGSRTLVGSDTNTAYQQWKYVPVRRIALFIEQTLIRNLGWVVFEPNDEPLWAAIRGSIEGFMLSLFNQGAFQGSTPSLAFQVKCDKSTTTVQDVNNGIVNIVVAFAPLKPAEFVIIKIAQLAGQVQS
ncbi:phage tail sheath family protein [Nostoc sp.]|uniref:phage tail sheath family protein n=1 Tax=Nostoc sp. TaxID=1180 RepID=UPI002FFCEDBC